MLAGKKWRNIENIRGKRGGEKLKNAEMRGINNNMRCFEIVITFFISFNLFKINNNMRCFEIQNQARELLGLRRINNNMRCFEIQEKCQMHPLDSR